MCPVGCEWHTNARGGYQYHHNHPQVLARANGWVAWVDEGMRPLIEEAWEMGIETTASCQGTSDHLGYVGFPPDDRMDEALALWGFDLDQCLAKGHIFTWGDRISVVRFPRL